MAKLYHVTASVNRQSIERHGLDWTKMGATCGIAGSLVPEQEGIFLARDPAEAEWFAGFGQVKPVDIWEVDMTDLESRDELDGSILYKDRIAAERLKLIDVRVPAGDQRTRSLPRTEWANAPALHESVLQKLSKAERRRLSQ